jgi:hypothetical protein
MESLLEVARLRKQRAQSGVAVAEIKVSETQAKLDKLRNRPTPQSDMLDLGLAAASALWPQRRDELLVPVQSEMAKRLTELSIARHEAAKSSAAEEAIQYRLDIAKKAERRVRDAKRHERWIQEQLCQR